MKRKMVIMLVSTIGIIILGVVMMTWFYNKESGEPKPREVELELVNPITGDVIKNGDTIELPKKKTYIEVRIKDKETGRYLTDRDLPENTIANSYRTGFTILSPDRNNNVPLYTSGYWPTLEEINERPYYNEYEVAISFDCETQSTIDSKTMPKYRSCHTYINFYISK